MLMARSLVVPLRKCRALFAQGTAHRAIFDVRIRYRRKKMASASLDRIDLRILDLLQREGRISNAELAQRVNLSPAPTLRRVQRLEATGAIVGYNAEVDPHAVGLGLHAFVRVQLERHSSESVARFAESVASWNEVVACYALTGEMDYLLEVWVDDLEHYSAFAMGKLMNAAGVADVSSSFVLRAVKRVRGVPLQRSAAAPATSPMRRRRQRR